MCFFFALVILQGEDNFRFHVSNLILMSIFPGPKEQSCDQVQHSWDTCGNQQVQIIGKNEKHQVTLMMASTASGDLLKSQVIVPGKSHWSLLVTKPTPYLNSLHFSNHFAYHITFPLLSHDCQAHVRLFEQPPHS